MKEFYTIILILCILCVKEYEYKKSSGKKPRSSKSNNGSGHKCRDDNGAMIPCGGPKDHGSSSKKYRNTSFCVIG